MSKIEVPFHIDVNAEFRFAIVLESRSTEAHSLMDSGNNKSLLKMELEGITSFDNLRDMLEDLIAVWKEKHKG